MAQTILTRRQQLLLSLLSQQKTIQEHFYLSGGTALAEYYLHHRYSEDLDFFSLEEVDPNGEEVPEEILAKDQVRREGHNRLAKGMEGSFKRKMREIGEAPTESSSARNTQAVTRLLLGNPSVEELGLGRRIWDATLHGRRTDAPPPTYVHNLRPLLDWDRGVSQQNLALTFDSYLRTTQIITNKRFP